jgi:hypothetical protein
MLPRALLALSIPLALLAGCRRSSPDEATQTAAPPPAGLTKCNAGVLKAVDLPTLPEVLKTYYTECADLHTKPACADAWRKAATLETPREQLALISEECRKVYCPDLGAYSLDLCRPDFDPTPAAVEKSWGPFLSAVIEREGGEYAAHLLPTLLGFYARTKQLEAKWTPPPSASAAPSASGAPPPAGSTAEAAPSTAAAPGGSAAPLPPAASATPKVAAPKASAP